MKTLNRGSRNLLALVICSLFLIVIGAGLPQIQAQNNTSGLQNNIEIFVEPLHKGTLIGITLDTNCQTYLKNNYTTNCPTYEQIKLLYNDLGCVYKGKYCLDHFRQIGKTNGYIIDPSAEVMDRIRMIEIRLNFAEFHIQDQGGYSNDEHTINYGLSRYVDSCRLAYVDSNNWMYLTGDTIMYLFSGCTKTYMIEGYSVAINQTEHNIADSYKWKLEQWQKEVINKCGTKICLYEKGQPSPP